MTTDILTQTFISIRPRLKALADRLLNSQEEADDALQEAFYRLWKKRNESEEPAKRSETEGLAMTTVRNLCLDTIRRSTVRQTTSIDDPESNVSMLRQDNDIEEQQQKAETLKRVTTLIESTLTERQRIILYMRDRDGFEMSEIAERFEISEANVRIILSRARKAVRQAYIKSSRQ